MVQVVVIVTVCPTVLFRIGVQNRSALTIRSQAGFDSNDNFGVRFLRSDSMQVNPLGNGPNVGFPSKQNLEPGNNQNSALTGNGKAGSQQPANIADLVGRLSIGSLVSLLNNSTENRAEKVEQARVKLVTGQYLLPESARQAADSILGLFAENQNKSSRGDG